MENTMILQNFIARFCFILKNSSRIFLQYLDSFRYGVDPIITREEHSMFQEMEASRLNYRYLSGSIVTGMALADFYFCWFCEKFLNDYRIINWWNGDETVYIAATRALMITKR